MINQFWSLRQDLNKDESYWPPDGTCRCIRCARPFKRDGDCKTHVTKKFCSNPIRSRDGSQTDSFIKDRKRAKKIAEDESKTITIGDEKVPLNMLPEFVYLGHLVRYDGNKMFNLKRRMNKAQSAFGALYRIWKEDLIHLSIKLIAYQAFVASIFSYGCESWILDYNFCKKVNHWNALNMSKLTKRTIPDEKRKPTFDILKKIRKYRTEWLRISFLNSPSEPLTKSLHYQNLHRRPGDIFSDFKEVSNQRMLEYLKRDNWKLILLPKELQS